MALRFHENDGSSHTADLRYKTVARFNFIETPLQGKDCVKSRKAAEWKRQGALMVENPIEYDLWVSAYQDAMIRRLADQAGK